MPDPIDGAPDAETADGFVSESYSAPFTEAPADTTAVAGAPDAEPVAAVEEEPVAGEASASASAAPAKAAPAAKPAGKGTLATRVATLQKQVDTLTHAKHSTAAEVKAAEDRLAALRADLDAAERKKAGLAPAAAEPPPAKDAAADPGPGAMPEHPKYRDFETDEAYEEAVGKWRTDLAAWQTASATALEARITKGLETRLEGRTREEQERSTQQTMVATLDQVRGTKADWDEKAEAIKDIRSSWYDSTKHGQMGQTPFLTDLARSLLSMGRAEGAEMLYFLGEDPDRAQALADLLPTRPLRDALVHAPSVLPLLTHFATPEGAEEWESLKQMHPVVMFQALGTLSARLAPVSRGSGAAAVHPITRAVPSARPPAGTPGSHPAQAVNEGVKPFEEWMAEEDAKDLEKRKRDLGITA